MPHRKALTLIFTFMIFITNLSWGQAQESNDLKLQTVEYVDLNKYQGTWYEVARFPHKFQDNCFQTTATYSLRSDGDIDVTNRCVDQESGQLRVAKGRAWVVDTNTQAKLKVQFFLNFVRLPFLAGDYWVIELDNEQYSYSVVSEPKGENLWILSRTQTFSQETLEKIKEELQARGFDLSKLIIDPTIEFTGP